MASSQSFSMIQRRMLLSPWPASPVKSELPLCTSAMRLPSGVPCFIFESMLARKSIWPSLERVSERVLRVARVLDHEARVLDAVLAAHALQVALPALAVGRIGEHEVELARREGVVRERRVLGPADDVVRRLALALEQQVGLADGVGLGVDLLAVEMGGHLLAVLRGELLERLLGDGQHAAGAAGAVVEQVGARLDLVGDGQEDQLRHELHGVARRPVLARLLVVLLVEAPDQLLEHRAHAVVVEAGVLHRAVAVQHGVGAQVDVRREELLDQRAERVGLGEPRDLVAELEVLEDVLDVRREAVEIGLEVGLELLLAGAGLEIAQRELRGVVERLRRRPAAGPGPDWTIFALSSDAFMSSTACLVGSSTASSRRSTVIGRMTSRYLPRT